MKNREIKFRGRRTSDGVWIYGDLITGLNHEYYIRHIIKSGNSKYAEITMVDPKTIGQFTGIKDKNDKDIYEGDIISVIGKNYRSYYHKSIQVIYSDRFAEFRCQVSNSLSHYITLGCKFEVIGNLHENPELLTNF